MDKITVRQQINDFISRNYDITYISKGLTFKINSIRNGTLKKEIEEKFSL